MELELGLALALPSHNPSMIRGLDLNHDSDGSTTEARRVNYRPKWVFLKAHDAGVETATLSLLLWSGGRRQMDEDNGDRHPKWRKIHVDDESSDDDCQVIEGWPPVNSSRKEPTRCGQGDVSTLPEQVRKSMHVRFLDRCGSLIAGYSSNRSNVYRY